MRTSRCNNLKYRSQKSSALLPKFRAQGMVLVGEAWLLAGTHVVTVHGGTLSRVPVMSSARKCDEMYLISGKK